MAMAARKGIPVSLSVRGVEEVRDVLKKGAHLARVGTLETALYQALRAWHQTVTTGLARRGVEAGRRLMSYGVWHEVEWLGAKGI